MKFAALAIASILSWAPASQAVVLYSTGFDTVPASPAFAVGALNAQNGWISVNQVGADIVGLRVVTAASESIPASSGTQVIRSVSPTAVSDSRQAYIPLENEFAARPAGENVVVTSVRVYRPSSQTSDSSAHGVLSFSLPNASLVSTLLGGFYFAPVDGAVVYASEVGTDADSGLVIPTNTWTTVNLFADYNTGIGGVEINGTVFQRSSFVPAFTPIFGDSDLFNFSASPTTVSTVYFDNYVVSTQTAIPEPASLGLAVAAIGLILRRKRV